MAYGKIQVDEIENSSGDVFDLSHSSLAGTSDSGLHPASSIDAEDGSTVQEHLDTVESKVGDVAFYPLTSIDDLKSVDESSLVNGNVYKVIGYDSQTDYSVAVDRGAGFYMWSTDYGVSDCDGVNLIAHGSATGGAFQLIESKTPFFKQHNNTDCVAVGQSSTVSDTRWNYEKLTGVGVASSDGGANYAWGADCTGEEYVELTLPYGVVIGDSIAEGRPMQDGRLGGGTYDPDLENTPGCPSVEMAIRTGTYWYNHGWRGQTTTEIVARWPRDVLGETYDPGDGIGDQTLPVGTKPYAVWVNAGINDSSWGYVNTDGKEEEIKSNFIYMAESARENGITIIFNTIGPDGNDTSSTSYQKQIEINAWLKEEMPKRGAYVFDYRAWLVNPDDYNINTNLAYDAIHPNKAGQISLCQKMLKQTKAPVVLSSIVIESRVDPDNYPDLWEEMTGCRIINVDDGTSQQVSVVDGVGVGAKMSYPRTHDSVIRVNPNNFNGESTSADGWTGVSAVYCEFDRYEVKDNKKEFNFVLSCDTGVWSLSDSYDSGSISNVFTLTQSTDGLTLEFERSVKFTSISAGLTSAFTPAFGYSGDDWPTNTVEVRMKDATLADIDPSTLADGERVYISGSLI